jgi:hypothetical protein
MEGSDLTRADPHHRLLVLGALVAALGLAGAAQAQRASPAFQRYVWKHHPCLARITEAPEGNWDTTVDYGGGHGNTAESYGIWQANPGTKMASAGRDWATNPWTQLRWAVGYAVGRYGSECGAWAFRR